MALPQMVTIGRRDFLRAATAALAGAAIGRARAADGDAGAFGPHFGRAKRVLMLFEGGGMSQMDLWDPKPDAPSDRRSPYEPIKTSAPGVRLTRLLPLTANVADKLSIVRSMNHRVPKFDHGPGQVYMTTGEPPGGTMTMPDIGSVVSLRIGTGCDYLPAYIWTPGSGGEANNAGYLSPSYGRFRPSGELTNAKWRLSEFELLGGIDQGRFTRRLQLRRSLDTGLGIETSDEQAAVREFYEKASDLVANPKSVDAFDLSREPEAIRAAYGKGRRGQSYLLGRRLIEHGVRFVRVSVVDDPGPGGKSDWDHHANIYSAERGTTGHWGIESPQMAPSFDRAFATLINDMDARGLLEDTLVCVATEFGRTPGVQKPDATQGPGRDHWTKAYSVVFAGAGVPGGQAIGATDRDGGYVTERSYHPEDFAASIYELLGIDRTVPMESPDGRPIFLAKNGGMIRELV